MLRKLILAMAVLAMAAIPLSALARDDQLGSLGTGPASHT